MPSIHDALACLNRQHQIDFFIETTCISAPSKQERNFAQYVEPILKELGFSVSYDQAHHAFDGNCGNLIAYWPGTDPSVEPLLFSGHMDTILDTGSCCPVVRDGNICADGHSILGADDRSAISSYIEAIRAIQDSRMPCGPIEFVFTVNEQGGLRGAKHLDYHLVKSRYGYIFDNPGDVGQAIDRAPYWQAFNIWFRMKGGSAGGHIAEKGDVPNAFTMGMQAYQNMELGFSIDRESVALIGLMQGGECSSVVPGELYMRGEIRAFRQEELTRRLNQIHIACKDAVNAYDGELNFELDGDYTGYEISEDDKIYRCFSDSVKELGLFSYKEGLLGGTDTNFFRANGIECMTMGQGYRGAHTPNEYVSIENLENTARLTIALVNTWYQLHQKKAGI